MSPLIRRKHLAIPLARFSWKFLEWPLKTQIRRSSTRRSLKQLRNHVLKRDRHHRNKRRKLHPMPMRTFLNLGPPPRKVLFAPNAKASSIQCKICTRTKNSVQGHPPNVPGLRRATISRDCCRLAWSHPQARHHRAWCLFRPRREEMTVVLECLMTWFLLRLRLRQHQHQHRRHPKKATVYSRTLNSPCKSISVKTITTITWCES